MRGGFVKDVLADFADLKLFSPYIQLLLADLENEALHLGRAAPLFLVFFRNPRTTIQAPGGESLCALLRSEAALSWGRIRVGPLDRVAASCWGGAHGT